MTDVEPNRGGNFLSEVFHPMPRDTVRSGPPERDLRRVRLVVAAWVQTRHGGIQQPGSPQWDAAAGELRELLCALGLAQDER